MHDDNGLVCASLEI